MAYEFVDEPEKKQSFGEALKKGAKEVVRHPSRVASNIATRAIGFPGDVLELANEFIARPVAKAISGEEGLPYEQTFLGKAIPTTEFHRKGVQEATGEFLKPQNKVESFIDDVVDDAQSLLMPGPKGAKFKNALPKKLAISLGGNLAGEAIEDAGGSPEGANLAKMGTLFTLSLFDKKGAAKHLADLYKQAEANLPANASINSNRLMANLSGLKNKILKGRPISNLSPSEKFVMDQIEKIESLESGGKFSVEQLWAQKRSLNEDLAKQLFDTPTKEAQGRARKLAKSLTRWMGEELTDYSHRNPSFGKPFKAAEEGFGTIAQSNLMSRFVEKNLKYTPFTSGLLHMFGGQVGSMAAKSVAPYQIGKLTYRIAKSPTLAKYYASAVAAASKENAVAFNKYLKKLDEELQKIESEEKYEFVD